MIEVFFINIAVANVNEELQVSGVTKNGGLWHTIRHANGTWDHFIDVKSQAGNPGAFTSVASAYVLVTIPARVVILVQDVGPRFLDAHEIPSAIQCRDPKPPEQRHAALGSDAGAGKPVSHTAGLQRPLP